MCRLLVTMNDIQRYKVITEIMEKEITAKDASDVLSLSYRHTLRLKDKVRDFGFEALLRKSPSCPPNIRISRQMEDEIINLRKRFYSDFNIMHLKDKLDEYHGIHLSYESLRQILIRHEAHNPKKKKVVHRQRRRMPNAGMLVQMDSSQHQWLEHIEEKWWLIAMIDDATNEVAYAGFFPADTVFAKEDASPSWVIANAHIPLNITGRWWQYRITLRNDGVA